MYFVTGFLLIFEEFVLSICSLVLSNCLSKSMPNLETYFTGFV